MIEMAVETHAMIGHQRTDDALTPESLRRINAYWRAANYLSVGQIYLYENPLLKEPLRLSHVKPWWWGMGVRRRSNPWLVHRRTYRRTDQPQPACARIQGRGRHHDGL
jgi:hypothetical protein